MSDFGPPPDPSPVPPAWPAPLPAQRRRQWSIFAFLTFAVAVTLGVAIVGWFRPLPAKPPPPPTYTAQQTADAKAKVCAAYGRVHNAINASTSRDRGTDRTSQLIFAINGQQAIIAGTEYLRTVLSQQPAVPSDLAKAVRHLTDTFQELVVEYHNNLPEVEEAPTVHDADDATLKIERLCA